MKIFILYTEEKYTLTTVGMQRISIGSEISKHTVNVLQCICCYFCRVHLELRKKDVLKGKQAQMRECREVEEIVLDTYLSVLFFICWDILKQIVSFF